MTDATEMLRVKAVNKSFSVKWQAPVSAVKNATFSVREGEFFTLLGPSGCGKTTLLRMIAGVETPDSGIISIAGKPVFSGVENINMPVSRRKLGMVFQSFAIWPHMSVFENAAFPLQVLRKKNGWSKSDIRQMVMDVLAQVSLSEIAERNGADLSGGQMQRLALARAIVAKPRLILLDEPLSNLDAKLREQLRKELKTLQAELGLTLIYVTHDQHEALSLSHRIAVMWGGEIQQIGSPEEIYRNPTSKFVADFVGKGNFIDAGAQMIRPEDVQFSSVPLSGEGWQQGIISSKEYYGDHTEIGIEHAGKTILVKLESDQTVKVGATGYFRFGEQKLIRL